MSDRASADVAAIPHLCVKGAASGLPPVAFMVNVPVEDEKRRAEARGAPPVTG